VFQLGISEAVHHWGRYRRDHVAVISDERAISYGELDRIAEALARRLAALGVAPQAPIGVIAKDPLHLLHAVIGVLRVGGQVILLNPWLPRESLVAALVDSNAQVIVLDDADDTLHGLVLDGRTVVGLQGAAGEAPPRRPDRGTPERELRPMESALVRRSDWVWGVIYSSGTTGVPKGVVRTDHSMGMEFFGWIVELPLLPSSNVYLGRPICYTGGFVIASSTLLVGGTLIAPRVHEDEAYWRACAARRVDLAFFIPDQVAAMVDAAGRGVTGPARAERLLVTGSTLSYATKRAIPDALGSELIESWGNSEGLGTITEPGDLVIRPRSIGRPFVSDALLVLDDAGNEVPVGTIGRIAGAADSQLRQYLNRDDLDRTMLKHGLTISEDLGYVDEEGYLYIAGRAVERMMRGGIPIFASDIEHCLEGLPSIKAATVVGLPDPTEGHVPAAAIVLRDGHRVEPEELLRAANQVLPAVHRLARLRVVDRFEVNAAGKVILDEVRRLFEPEAGASQASKPVLARC
jgi:acyl-coenzyme A synthetase/AMP-(fatty) acid ligase